MRRFSVVFLVAALACSAPAITLSPSFDASRSYRLNADSKRDATIGSAITTSHSILASDATIKPLSEKAGETTLQITVAPTKFVVDGRKQTPPARSQSEIAVGSDGGVLRTVSVGGIPVTAATDVEDLAPVLGVPLPTGTLHLGQRWHRIIEAPAGKAGDPPLGPGRQDGRVAGLRTVDGYDCAILIIGTQRPLIREDTIDGQPVRLSGTEFSTEEIAFAFRAGFPVRFETHAEDRLTLLNQGFNVGSLVIRTMTVLELTA